MAALGAQRGPRPGDTPGLPPPSEEEPPEPATKAAGSLRTLALSRGRWDPIEGLFIEERHDGIHYLETSREEAKGEVKCR